MKKNIKEQTVGEGAGTEVTVATQRCCLETETQDAPQIRLGGGSALGRAQHTRYLLPFCGSFPAVSSSSSFRTQSWLPFLCSGLPWNTCHALL